jgi:hypothetical protein
MIGDLSSKFALSTFFPERAHRSIDMASELCFAFLNMCGFVNIVRNWLGRQPTESDPINERSNEEQSL